MWHRASQPLAAWARVRGDFCQNTNVINLTQTVHLLHTNKLEPQQLQRHQQSITIAMPFFVTIDWLAIGRQNKNVGENYFAALRKWNKC